MSAERDAALDELLHQLRQAYMVKAAPPDAFSFTQPQRLADLVDACAAQLPAKYRAHVLKLERQIRAALLGWQGVALDVTQQLQVGEDANAVACRYAYQAGMLNGGLIQFTGQRTPAFKPTPPAKKGKP